MEVVNVNETEEIGSVPVPIVDNNLKKRTSRSPQKNADNHPESADDAEEEVEGVMNSKRLRTNQNSPRVGDEAGSASPIIPEKLEVPSKELQCIQKQVLIEKLMVTTTTTDSVDGSEDEEPMDIQSVVQEEKEIPISNKNHSKKPKPPSKMKPEDFRKTFKLRSSLLDRVKVFIPEIKNANEELLRLPDPSKISLESDSDEMDGTVAGPSGISTGKKPSASKEMDNKTYVEMNLALLEQSDSDSSTDDETTGGTQLMKGLPVINKNSTDPSPVKPIISDISGAVPEESLTSTVEEKVTNPEKISTSNDAATTGEKKSLITELN